MMIRRLAAVPLRAAAQPPLDRFSNSLSQRFLPLYIGFFQTMHTIRQRGQRPSVLTRAVLDKKSLLSPLLSLLLTSAP